MVQIFLLSNALSFSEAAAPHTSNDAFLRLLVQTTGLSQKGIKIRGYEIRNQHYPSYLHPQI